MSRTSGREKELSSQYGDLHAVIPDMVSRCGQEDTAKVLGVKQAWVSRWLNRNGYKRIVTWIKSAEVQ